MVLRACFTQICSLQRNHVKYTINYKKKTGSGVLYVSLLTALGKVIKTKALVPRGYKQQQLWYQWHKQ